VCLSEEKAYFYKRKRVVGESQAAEFIANASPQLYPDSFVELFSAVLLLAGEGVFAGSLEADDLSAVSAFFDGDSFLAASLYESLR
jgi:hypothetical protein